MRAAWSVRLRPRQKDLLVGSGDVHVQSLLGDRLQPRPAGSITNRRFEFDALRLERVELSLTLPDFDLLHDAVSSPCYDACRHQDETNQHERNERPPAGGYAAFRHARSRALRARGFRATSSSEAVIARLVIVVPSGRPRQVHTGCFGGQMQAALHSRKVFLTIRSSPEWYAITTKVPPGVSRSRSAGSARSSPGSSSLTAIRTA